MVDPLRELLDQAAEILPAYKEQKGVKLLGLSCEMVPPEILSACNVLPLRIPAAKKGAVCCCLDAEGEEPALISGVYDYILLPGKGACSMTHDIVAGEPVFRFDVPSGYGAEAAEELHHSIDRLLDGIGAPGLSAINPERLRESTEDYNTLRRLIRGISSIRADRPDLLSNADLWVIYNAAASMPPDVVMGPLAAILDAMNRPAGDAGESPRCKALVSGGFLKSGEVLDAIEESGCLVQEDDFCNGRRQFDISHNPASPYLYYEILDAFTYSPLCPSLRPAGERYELLYKMLRNYGIHLVIFLNDTLCKAAGSGVDFLRIKLMRSGIDPLITESGNAPDSVKEYIKAVERP